MKKLGTILGIVVVSILGLFALLVAILMIAGMGAYIVERIESILTLATIVGSLYVIYRAVITIKALILIISRCIDRDRLNRLMDWKALIVLIVFLLVLPISTFLSIIHSKIPEGDYVINVNYSLSGEEELYDVATEEYYYKCISEEGITPMTINVNHYKEYEDRISFIGAYEQEYTGVAYYSCISALSIKLPDENGSEYYIEQDDIEPNREYDYEIEYNNVTCMLTYKIGDLSDESLGYTLEDKFNDFTTKEKVEVIILVLLDLVSIAGYFFALLYDKKYTIV